MTEKYVTLPREVVERALDALARGCLPDCKDGMTDSGGVHPWGEAALIECPSCQAVEALRAALDHPQNHVPDAGNMAPAGWKLVPSDATHQWAENLADRGMRISSLASAISDMLAAAPQPPTVKHSVTVEQQQGEQEPVALLADAIRAEPTELIHKWRVLELVQDHAHPQPKREPLTVEQIKQAVRPLYHSQHQAALSAENDIEIARAVEAAHNIK